jgi:hypothetical protein
MKPIAVLHVSMCDEYGAGFDGAYDSYAYSYQRQLLRRAAEWAASEPAPIAVQAPLCVHAVPVRQVKDGERLVIQLFNDVNTSAMLVIELDPPHLP